jgi:hypothetical protein
VQESDFRTEDVDPGFSWEGPSMYSYYYPSGEPVKIKKTDFNGLIINLNQSHNFFKILDEGYFVKVTKFWTAAPKTELQTVSSNYESFGEAKLYKNLSVGSYFISNKGKGLGNFSWYAEKPCFYFQIIE